MAALVAFGHRHRCILLITHWTLEPPTACRKGRPVPHPESKQPGGGTANPVRMPASSTVVAERTLGINHVALRRDLVGFSRSLLPVNPSVMVVDVISTDRMIVMVTKSFKVKRDRSVVAHDVMIRT